MQTHLVAGEVRDVVWRVDDVLHTAIERVVHRVVEALHVAFTTPNLPTSLSCQLRSTLNATDSIAHLLAGPVRCVVAPVAHGLNCER